MYIHCRQWFIICFVSILGNCTSKNATFDTGIIWLCVLLYTVLILCLPDRDFDDKKDKQFIEDKTLVGTIIYLENCQ